MSQPITKHFPITKGTAKLRLDWHTSDSLPDLAGAPVVSVRKSHLGFEWATVATKCPHCGEEFTIENCPGSATGCRLPLLSEISLTKDALSLLELVGNVSADLRTDVAVLCPHCETSFFASPDAAEKVLTVHVTDDEVVVSSADGTTVRFMPDGRATAVPRQNGKVPGPSGDDLLSLPCYIGESKEARDWICLALGIKVKEKGPNAEVDILDLALRHRFKGYGEEFIQQAKAFVTQPKMRSEIVEALYMLPRHCYSDGFLCRLLAGTGLPYKPSVKKAASQNIIAPLIVEKLGLGGLCGGDPNLAVRLLKSLDPNAAWTGSLINDEGKLSGFVSLALREERPAYLLKRILDLDKGVLKECIDHYGELKLDPYAELKAYRLARRDHSLSSIIRKPSLLEVYAKLSDSVPIKYAEDHAALEGSYDGFSFNLPLETGEFAIAGSKLNNCLDEGYAALATVGCRLVFLITCGGSLVAAAEVYPGVNEVVQVFAKSNTWISLTGDLGAAIVHWARDKKLALSGRLFL